jgi:hypothetical protein
VYSGASTWCLVQATCHHCRLDIDSACCTAIHACVSVLHGVFYRHLRFAAHRTCTGMSQPFVVLLRAAALCFLAGLAAMARSGYLRIGMQPGSNQTSCTAGSRQLLLLPRSQAAECAAAAHPLHQQQQQAVAGKSADRRSAATRVCGCGRGELGALRYAAPYLAFACGWVSCTERRLVHHSASGLQCMSVQGRVLHSIQLAGPRSVCARCCAHLQTPHVKHHSTHAADCWGS